VYVADEKKNGESFGFGIDLAEATRAVLFGGLVAVVGWLFALFGWSPSVPAWMHLTPDQLKLVIAFFLWVGAALAVALVRKWRSRRKHVEGEAHPGGVAIWVAELQGDDKEGEHRTNVVGTLQRGLGQAAQILRAPIELRIEESGDAAEDTVEANREAQEYLRSKKGDLLIWGRVLDVNPVVIELRFASPIHDGTVGDRYNYDPKFRLESSFNTELGAALAAVAARQALPATDTGKYVADVVQPVAAKLAKLAKHPPISMGPNERGQLFYSYGLIEQRIGEQRGDSQALERAVQAYEKALGEWKRDQVPLQWATIQNTLGTALTRRGERQDGTARFNEAIQVFQLALQENTRELAPLQWAAIQNNLGTALARLGERQTAIAPLKESIAAFHAALGERTRDRAPLEWAQTQNNLGSALLLLGLSEPGVVRAEEAIVAFQAALEVLARELVPLQWAMLQHNLGVALAMLGDRKNETARLEEAIIAFRAALEVRDREHMPLDWAQTQANLGQALAALGERDHGTTRLHEASIALTAAREGLMAAGVKHYDQPLNDQIQKVQALIAELGSPKNSSSPAQI
jgi:tetratricopeptide (TPR) repeat protein